MGSHRARGPPHAPPLIRTGVIACPPVAYTTANHDGDAREGDRSCFGPTMEKRTLTRLALSGAAASLREGREDALTVRRLWITGKLKLTLQPTNLRIR